MSAGHAVALVLLWLGVAAVALSAIGVLVVRDDFARLHFVTPAAVVGVPLIALSLVVDMGLSSSAAQVAVIAVLTAASAPVVTSATGHAFRREREFSAEPPREEE